MIKTLGITLILISQFSQAEENSVYQGLSSSTAKSPMELMIENESEMKQIYETCQAATAQDPSASIAECVNQGFEHLDKDVQQRITQKYLKTDDTAESYDSANLATIKNDSNEDPAITNLKNYLYQRLQEALYGEVAAEGKKQSKVVDHKVFLELYKSQVSKNIITSLTSYCIDSDLENNFIIYDPQKVSCSQNIDCKLPTNRNSKCLACVHERNRSLLGQVVDQNGERTLAGAQKWQECIQQIQHICHRDDGLKGVYQTMKDEEIAYSQQRACEVTTYLKSLRQNLLRLSEIEEQFKINDQVQARSIAAENVKIYNGAEEGNTIDDLTSITSKEFAEKSNYDQGVEDLQKLAAQCKEAGDQSACKKFLIATEERENLEQANAEYATRSAAMETKIKDMKESEIRSYLQDEGRSEESIDQIIQSAKKEGGDWESALASDIANKYEQERLQVIKRINQQIESKSAKNNNFTYTEENVPLIDRIEGELSSRAEEFKELIHFNNIVSGYLSIEDGEGETSRNTASLTRELDDSAFSQSAEEDEGYFDELNQAIEETKIDRSRNQEDAVNIEVETINEKLLSQ